MKCSLYSHNQHLKFYLLKKIAKKFKLNFSKMTGDHFANSYSQYFTKTLRSAAKIPVEDVRFYPFNKTK